MDRLDFLPDVFVGDQPFDSFFSNSSFCHCEENYFERSVREMEIRGNDEESKKDEIALLTLAMTGKH